jgi:hypothetical protein
VSRRIVEDIAFVAGQKVEAHAYPDGRAFVALGDVRLSVEDARALSAALGQAAVRAALIPSEESVKTGGGK